MTKRWIAAVPSLRRPMTQITALRDCLTEAGCEPFVVATGRRLDDTLTQAGFSHVSPRANPGFGASVQAAVDAAAARGPAEWSWLLVVNDDLEFEAADLAAVMGALERDHGSEPCLAFLDPEPRRPIPGVLGTWCNLALVPALVSRTPAGARPGYYKSFSLVAISRSAWERLEGFDDSITYTFEDADFARRAHAGGVAVVDQPLRSLYHEKSGTSRTLVSRVLPVSVDSARRYLLAAGTAPFLARAVVLSALVVRLAGALARPHRGAHVRGIARAARATVNGTSPSLPAYEEC